jgi:hypothetical protein
VPKRLATTLRKAKKAGLVDGDDDGLYLTDEGAAAVDGFQI